MILSEIDAKRKWCPIFYQASVAVAVKIGSIGAETAIAAGKCQGQDCMMWRRWNVTSEGYCGLAGKPL